jgi:hypothetical protein
VLEPIRSSSRAPTNRISPASAVAHSTRGDEEEGCLDMGRVNRAGPGRRRSSPATDQRALVVLPAGATVPALLGLVAVGHGEAA